MKTVYQMYVDGEWVDSSSGKTFASENPFNGELWASIPEADEQDAEKAISAARNAFDNEWHRVNGLQRAKLMNTLADLIDDNAGHLSRIETTDNGKVIRETETQMHYAARIYRFFAGYADKLYGKAIPLDHPSLFDYTIREPLGVVLLITAWNSPIALLANKLPPALAAGNTAVVKPSSYTSASTLEFAKLVEAAGFPKGVFNVVTGGGAVVGDYLTRSSMIDKISFTGGTSTGRHILQNASTNITRASLELGGKSPNIIFADANMDRAVTGALAGIFAATGQTCIAGSRLLVEESVFERVVDAVAQRARNIRIGNPLEKETEMGPVANRHQFQEILAHIESAIAEGAQVVTGGKRVKHGQMSKGYFIAPTVLTVTNDMSIAQTEVFGPVLSVIRFKNEDEAVRIANDTVYGLASGVWTSDLNRAHRMARAIQAGVVWINTYRSSAAQAPFGGYKQSGYGRERGEEALFDYTQVKNVMMDLSSNVRDPFLIKV
ncbi:MAG: aldehyde dehydrogenase [Desulfobacterales bacterium]|nr:aldehyde dehydrogenase [Desulfobacterales bacterium]